jgi:hypothetical protein
VGLVVSFAGGVIYAPIATVGGDGGGDAVEWWRSGDGEDSGGFPSLAAPLKDRIGECRWGMATEGEPRTKSRPAPHLYI